MDKTFNNFNLLLTLLRWWKTVVIVGVITVAVSYFVSSPLVIRPKFQSEATIYPVNLAKFSGESESEQMLQILESNYIRDRIMEDFPFAEYYKVDSTEDEFYSTLYKKYDKDFTFESTEYSSVKIEVLNFDPQIAADMVDSVISYFNEKVRQMHRKKTKEVVVGKKITMKNKKKEIEILESLQDSLRHNYGILDYAVQTERLTEGYIKLLSSVSPNEKYLDEIRQKLRNLEQRGGEFLALSSLIWSARNVYNSAKVEYEIALQEYNKRITYVQVISTPYPADKKAYPTRWLIVLLSLIGSMVVTFTTIGFIENKDDLLT